MEYPDHSRPPPTPGASQDATVGWEPQQANNSGHVLLNDGGGEI